MSSDVGSPRVVVVVVAHDRRQLLAECLDGIAAQTRPADAALVVDNASSDDSADLADGHPLRPEVVRLDRNTGGAGGFAAGLARAIHTHSADLVWLMDDDTVPTPGALEELLRAREAVGDPALVASRAIWTDGTEHPMNRPRRRWGARAVASEVAAGVVPVRSASFVSLMVSADAVRKHGLPLADYFIWNDDFEFTLRLLRRDRGYYATRSVVVHKTRALGSSDADPGDRFFYEVRNKLWLFRFSPGLSFRDRLLYGAGTARRWVRSLCFSTDRRRLLAAGRRGLREGLGHRPRSTTDVLSDLPEVRPDVDAVARERTP